MKKGFTLVELMVSVAVVGILSASVLIGWRPARAMFHLRHAAFQVAGDLRRTQQLSLSTHQFNCQTLPPENYTGFGLYINTSTPTSYQVFENCSSDNHTWDSGETKETLYFPKGVIIQGLKKGGTSVSSLSILFVPPNPDTYIDETSSGTEAEITLTNGASTAVIKINNSGRIEIN